MNEFSSLREMSAGPDRGDFSSVELTQALGPHTAGQCALN